MSTLQQQLAFALLTLLFGVLARSVSRRAFSGRHDRQEVAWRITAAYFVLSGGYGVVHATLAFAAVGAGPGSALYGEFVRWMGPANVGRQVAAAVFAALILCAQAAAPDRGRAAARSAPLLLVGAAAAGTLVTGAIGGDAIHWLASTLAVSTTVMTLLLLTGLLFALTRDGMDEVLWLTLTAFVLKEVLSVSLMSILAWWGPAGTGTLRLFYWMNLGVMLGMCIAAAWRLREAAAGRRVPSLFERVRAVRPPTMGWDNMR